MVSLVASLAGFASAQTIVASGKLLDTKNKGIANVVVQLKGTDVRDTTDATGAWSLVQTTAKIVHGEVRERLTKISIDESFLRVQLSQPGMVDAWVVGLDGARLWSMTRQMPAGESIISHPRLSSQGVLFVRSGDQEIRQEWNPISRGNSVSNSVAGRSAATGTIQFLTLSGELISESPAPVVGGALNKSFSTFPVTGRFHNGDSAYVIDSTKGTIKYIAPVVMVDWKPASVKGRMYSGSTMIPFDLFYDPSTLSYSGTFLNPTPATRSWTSQILALDKSSHVTGIDSLEWNAAFVSSVAMQDINYWNAMPVITKYSWFNGYLGVSNPAMTIRDDFRIVPICTDTRSSHYRGRLEASVYVPYLKYEMSFNGGAWTEFEKLPADSGTPAFKLAHFPMPDLEGAYPFATRCTDDDSNVVVSLDTLRPIKDPPSNTLDFNRTKVYTIKDRISLTGECSDQNGAIIHAEWRLNGGAWNTIPQGFGFSNLSVTAPRTSGIANVETRCTDDDSNVVSKSVDVDVILDPPTSKIDYDRTRIYTVKDPVRITGICSDRYGYINSQKEWRTNEGEWNGFYSGSGGDSIVDVYAYAPKLGGSATIEIRCTDDDSNAVSASVSVPVLQDAPIARLYGISGWSPLLDSTAAPITKRNILGGCHDSLGTIARSWIVYNGDTGVLQRGYSPNGTYDRHDPDHKLSTGFYILRADGTVFGHAWGRAYSGDSTFAWTPTEFAESFNAQISNPVEFTQTNNSSVCSPDEDRHVEVGCQDDDGNITRAHMVMNACKGYDFIRYPYVWTTVQRPQ